MKVNQQATRTLSILLLILLLLPGCGEDSDQLPETATVKVMVFSPKLETN